MHKKLQQAAGLATGKNLAFIGKYTRPILLPLTGFSLVLAGSSLLGVASALIMRSLIDTASEAAVLKDVLRPALLMIAVVLTTIVSSSISSVIAVSLTERFSMNLRQSLFNHTCRAQWLPLSAYHSGDLLTRMTSDVGAITNNVVNTIPGMISLVVRFLASFAALMVFDPSLAFFALVLGPLSIVVVRVLAKKLSFLYKKIQETESRFRSFIQETMANSAVVKVFSGEEASVNKLNELHKERMHWVIKRNRLSVSSSIALSLGYYVGYLGALLRGIQGIIAGTTSFGTLTAFLQLVSQVQGPVIALAQTMPGLVGMLASADRIRQIMDLSLEEPAGNLSVSSVGLRLSGVSFGYSRSEQADKRLYQDPLVLQNISLQVNPGEIVSVMGISGAGKTTFIRLLLALVPPSKGTITFIDKSGNRYPASPSTRSLISYVPQGNTLISGTIAENLRLAKPGATDAEMKNALARAAADFVFSLPEGLETVVGERGTGLSEGQAQRLAIARALLRGAPFLILDEATSALDLALEKQLYENIKQMNITCLTITHRTYALKVSDRTYQLSEGRLRQIGEAEKIDAVL